MSFPPHELRTAMVTVSGPAQRRIRNDRSATIGKPAVGGRAAPDQAAVEELIDHRAGVRGSDR